MRKLIIFLVLVVCVEYCMAQSENFAALPKHNINVINDTIKKELAVVVGKAAFLPENNNVADKIELIEIPATRCSDSFVYFQKGNFFTSDFFVGMHSSGATPNVKIKGISIAFSKPTVLIPDTALADIVNPIFCPKCSKKGKPITCNCKVFKSVDKRRIYINMVNGEGQGKFQVTWIIKDKEYYGRVIEML